MEMIFSNVYKGNKFSAFSTEHLIAIGLFLVGCILLFVCRNGLRKHDKQVRTFLFSFLFLFEVGYNVWLLCSGRWNFASSLPLQLCTISIYLCLYTLLTKRFGVFEIVYFTGIGGALQAILTPELFFNFPHFRFFQFFISHTLIIWTCLYFTFSHGYRPTLKSIGKTFVFLNIVSFFVFFINKLTSGNYMFLAHKPTNGSLIDFLGPYPWYILSLELVAFVLFFLLYVPFLFTKGVRKHV